MRTCIQRLRLLRTLQVWNFVQAAKRETIVCLQKQFKVLINIFYMKMWNASQQKVKYTYLKETTFIARSSHCKWQVVVQGGECHKLDSNTGSGHLESGTISTTVLPLKAPYTSPTLLASYLGPQIDPKMLWFGSTPGIENPLGSHDSNEACLETDHSLQPAIGFLHQHTLASNRVCLVYQQQCHALIF